VTEGTQPAIVSQVLEQNNAQDNVQTPERDTTLAQSPRLTVAEPSPSAKPLVPVLAPLIALAIILTLITFGFSLRGRLTRVD
jgi:hypothetical protein